MVPRDRAHGAAAATAALTENLVQGPILNKKCEKNAPMKVHKSEREKHKRGKQNDLFGELGNMLEPDRQNNGKACILSDTTRILKDLRSQVESLQKENNILKNESHYVALERNELLDENNVIRSEISELQTELTMRCSIWSHGTTISNLTAAHPASTVFALQHSSHPPIIATMALPLQQPAVLEQSYAAPRRELQLFPESASTEDIELPQDQGTCNRVTRPQARYPTTMATLPVHEYPILSRMEDEQCSSGITGSGKSSSTE
ncbi:transcription factor BHLH062-like [Phragmites australis]|uniref:transcription factor BHLH062-like n=1 Tax=Phragmites australis TaxID=29695 RepID=UPI002D784CBF|nr:transcription factor BHLH062-like [Phragmites australis]XP_062188019.1 transcription factor BHLH062-like [Phragmites australis]